MHEQERYATPHFLARRIICGSVPNTPTMKFMPRSERRGIRRPDERDDSAGWRSEATSRASPLTAEHGIVAA
jgi:hypothetical protein